jgi:uncharacterized protein (DUF302 family)
MKNAIYGAVVLMLSIPAYAADNGIISKPSKYSVAQTIGRFEAVAKEKGAAVIARVDHSAGAEKVGMKMRPTQLLIFGNPKTGTPLMLSAPSMAIDLPLKVLAWEDEKGKVWLSYNSPEYLRKRHGFDKDLMKNLAAVEVIANKVLE